MMNKEQMVLEMQKAFEEMRTDRESLMLAEMTMDDYISLIKEDEQRVIVGTTNQ